MQVYRELVILLSFLVELLLLLGTNRLCGYPAGYVRCAMSAAFAGAYSGVCLISGLHFLGNVLWRSVSLLLMSLIAFGIRRSTLRAGTVFTLLHMALGGLMSGMGKGRPWVLPAAAGCICLLCVVGFCGRIGEASYVPVELSYCGKRIRLTALRDTGNTLRDPVTGSPVLVIGAEAAKQLTGLSYEQLRRPVESVGAIPGLRLIPYRSVGTANGLLLALKLAEVRIGTWKGSKLVAFAPEGLGSEDAYQALTGGTI